MTPAEHYAEAEALVERYQASFKAHDFPERVELLTEAQVHATLATVAPDVLWPQKTIIACTCPHLGANALARTSTDPDCPLHGQGKD